MQIDPAAEGLVIPFREPLFCAGVFPRPGELLHTHSSYAMRVDIKGASTSCGAELIKMTVQLLFDPLNAGLNQCDEIKVLME